MKRVAIFFVSAILLLLSGTSLLKAEEHAPDWKTTTSKKITLFYPGVASLDFLTSPDHKLGGRKILQGKRNCVRCHLDESGSIDLKANEIASGKATMKRSRKPLEPKPIPGKKGVFSAEMSVAYDDEYIYLRINWKSRGSGWKKTASTKKNHPDRVSLQVNKGRDYFARYGCFITCHNDLNSMPESPASETVSANTYYSKAARDDIRLYAYYTRIDKDGVVGRGTWADIKSDAELAKESADNGLIDLWSVEIKGGVATVRDGWIFVDRRWEKNSHVSAGADWVGKGSVGRYSVTLKRKLKTNDAKDVSLSDGDIFSTAISIHDDNAEKRQHYVSFPFTIGLGKNADIKADKIK